MPHEVLKLLYINDPYILEVVRMYIFLPGPVEEGAALEQVFQDLG